MSFVFGMKIKHRVVVPVVKDALLILFLVSFSQMSVQ